MTRLPLKFSWGDPQDSQAPQDPQAGIAAEPGADSFGETGRFDDKGGTLAPMNHADILDILNNGEFTDEQKAAIESLPWGDEPNRFARVDLRRAANILNSSHFGLTDLKQRILEFAAAQNRSPGFGKTILLDGKPGVGKTTIAASIAKALNRPMQRINCTSLMAAWEIMGSRP